MDSPVDFFKRLLLEMAKRKASSLHLIVGNSPLFRVNGRFVFDSEDVILKKEDLVKIINSFLNETEIIELEDKRELSIVKDFSEDFRFRVCIFYQKDTLSLTVNYISNEILDLDKIGFPTSFIRGLQRASGLLIVAGPPSSGKTMTASSIIEKINKEQCKLIMTLESPIEKVFVGKKSIIAQRQVGQDVSSYVSGLKYYLGEDVDVVYIDEIRDDFDKALPYILELATGSTLIILEVNAENSIRALEKIMNVNCASLSRESVRYLLADVLYGVVAQKLIPNREGSLSLAVEVLISSFAARSLIREGNIYQLENVIQNSGEDGMVSMEKSIKDMLLSGEIDRQDVGRDMDI
jgi:twitching motility protein PilT